MINYDNLKKSLKNLEVQIELIDDFIDDAIGLYQTMTGETWE